MAETTIEWTRGPRGELGYTFNGWIGCTKISPGCDHCYAAAQDKFRSWTPEGWGAGKPRRRTSEANWRAPLQWNKSAAAAGERRRVFCSSLADVFDNEVDPAWQADLFDLIRATPNLDWLLLTKRIGNAQKLLANGVLLTDFPNVWLGATIVNQEEADRDIPKLLATPARVRFLSMEPLLGPVDLTQHLWGRAAPCSWCPKDMDCECGLHPRGNIEGESALHQVIVGGESGPGARPMHPDWARGLRNQCKDAGVPFLFKQWGEWAPHPPTPGFDEGGALRSGHVRYLEGDGRVPDGHFRRGDAAVRRVGKKAAGRLLDGAEHNGFPAP